MTYAQYSNDLESNDQKVGERTRKYITVMPAFKYMYVNKPSFGLYSKLGLGLIRAFVEAGFGEQGIVLAGLKYRF